MPKAQKYRVVVALVIALIAILLLAAGLSGEPFAGAQPYRTDAPLSGRTLFIRSPDFLQSLGWVMAIYAVLIILVVAGLLSTPEGRRRVLAVLIAGALLFLLVRLTAPQGLPQPQPLLEQSENVTSAPPVAEATIIPQDNGTAAPIPDTAPRWVVTLIVLSLSVLGAGLITLLVVGVNRVRKPDLKDLLAQEAAAAVQAIDEGQDLADVVSRCYSQMSKALLSERGIVRESHMTPHEFETVLVHIGLPIKAVQTLTQLFEIVRYGRVQPGEEMAQAARGSLQAIVNHLDSSGGTVL